MCLKRCSWPFLWNNKNKMKWILVFSQFCDPLKTISLKLWGLKIGHNL